MITRRTTQVTRNGLGIVIALVVVLAAGSATSARGEAAPPPAPPVPPAETAAAAPSWVTAGTRITHHTSVATVPTGGYVLIEDPSGPLVDPVTGKRYSESYTAAAASGNGPGGAGEGFSEVNVAAVTGTDVVITRALWNNDRSPGLR